MYDVLYTIDLCLCSTAYIGVFSAYFIDPKMTDHVQIVVFFNLGFCTTRWFADMETGQEFKLLARLNRSFSVGTCTNHTHVTWWQSVLLPGIGLREKPTGEPAGFAGSNIAYLEMYEMFPISEMNPSIKSIPTNYIFSHEYIIIYLYIVCIRVYIYIHFYIYIYIYTYSHDPAHDLRGLRLSDSGRWVSDPSPGWCDLDRLDGEFTGDGDWYGFYPWFLGALP